MKPILGTNNTNGLSEFFNSAQHGCIFVGESINVFTDIIANIYKVNVESSVVTVMGPELGKKSISIEQVRENKKSLSLKRGNRARLLIISHAETMGHDAQNALLKLLEEPPEGLKIIFLVRTKQDLLSTIISRCRVMHVQNIEFQEALDGYQTQNVQSSGIEKMHLIARGRPGKLHNLLSVEGEHAELIDKTKKLIRASTYEKLTMHNDLCKDKTGLVSLLVTLDDVLRAVMHAKSSTDITRQQIAKKRQVVQESLTALEQNVNTKLVALDVLLLL